MSRTALRILTATALLTTAVACKNELSTSAFSNLPARFTLQNVQQAPALFTACHSMGEFCTITTDGKRYIFQGSSPEPSYVNVLAVNGYTGFYMGLSGFIVGLPTIMEMGMDVHRMVCFDLACSNCYQNYNITKPLALQEGYAYCRNCKRTYDLNNLGVIAKGEGGRPLYRYRISYVSQTLIINNR